ncbi:response regulator transcription factor [Sphingobium boeckii]|uniref:DNA-binding response OmpR family regulator n=1 Tax=Sphingobium boeckii TaxID=1082345 RepID=A0A7W9AEL3_9SPHN|nr:response regulator transcription factor [Sphingobium boeckii]MBB5684277.1 DNA-binding response OmpR family regulator [Sphingobium boeckii]
MRIAIVEDESGYSEFIANILKSAGYSVYDFATSTAFVKKFRRDTFDVVILDWNLAELSGIELLSWMRKDCQSSVPVVMLTSRSEPADIVTGLQSGADDYIAKPVDEAVLLARLEALSRRCYPSEQGRQSQVFGDFHFNVQAEQLSIGDMPMTLTSKEFNLALILFSNLSRPLSRTYLLESVWGRNPDLPTRTLDSHISRIRSKLGLRPEHGFRLTPIYSYGYRLEALTEAAVSPSLVA